MVVDGRMAGVWSHEQKRGGVEVHIDPFGNTRRWEREGAEGEAERLASFLGDDLVAVTWGRP